MRNEKYSPIKSNEAGIKKIVATICICIAGFVFTVYNLLKLFFYFLIFNAEVEFRFDFDDVE